jgi:predicted GIY-YIG superfamily endonuclease
VHGVFTLYRFYAADDSLLYIGLTVDPGRRMREHKAGKPWWTEIARIELEHLSSLEELRAAERAAIIAEQPLHNLALNTAQHRVSDRVKRETLEWFGWKCISNVGSGTFVKPDRPSAFYTRAAAWTQVQR